VSAVSGRYRGPAVSSETILDRINEPSDLRSLSRDELDRLCHEIREFIVRKVSESKSGGHLGSNLGIVELTVALHRVLESPDDVILFDTGHQAYVHKILSGRKADFDHLRGPASPTKKKGAQK
jgi:1-deoxy-D-xylulose-5-phosphate synthase